MILLLLGCSSSPQDALTWQEQYELLLLNAGGEIVDLRLGVSNTGTLKGMGHARGEIAGRKEATIRYGFDALPEEMEHTDALLRVGPDYLEQQGGTWQVLFREGDELDGYRDLRLGLAPADVQVDAFETEGWVVRPEVALGAASGVLAASGRQRILKGPAVLTWRGGTQPPAMDGDGRATVHVLDEATSLMAEQVGDTTRGWVVLDGVTHGDLTPAITRNERRWQIDYRPQVDLVVDVVQRKPEVEAQPWEHLTGLEQTLAGATYGVPSRRVTSGLAEFQVDGAPRTALALVVEVQVE